MKFYQVCATSFVLVTGLQALAQDKEICVKTPQEYEAVKASLPAVFRKLPVYFSYEGSLINAGIKLYAVDEKLKVEGLSRQFSFMKNESGYMTEACLKDGVFSLKMEKEEDGKPPKSKTIDVKLESDTEVNIKTKTFQASSSDAGYKKVIQKIHDLEDKQNSRNNNGGGNDGVR